MPQAAARPLAISMGEPAGIGPDLILRLYADRAALQLPGFVLYGNLDFLKARTKRLGLTIDLRAASPQDAIGLFPKSLPVADVAGLVADQPGAASHISGKMIIEAITRAVSDVMSGACRGLVTAPIHKAALYASGFSYPGHTEFLASLVASGGGTPMAVMMLAHGKLRAVPVTVHVPLRAVPALLTADRIAHTARVVAHDLHTRFGIGAPRLAMTGLNPHAGEGGTIGLEEKDVIEPALASLRHEGIDISGPFPADTMFYPPNWSSYDAVIAMYHDQALIPIKTLAFEEAVNVTLGLPFVRTSPDHGTAFDLAGTGKGSAKSFLAAIRLADNLTGGR